MKIYLAARYSRRAEMLGYAKELEEMGFTVTSRWITGIHEIPGKRDGHGANAYTTFERMRFAEEDVKDLREADAILAFTETPKDPSTTRGGRHVEFGLAIGLGKALLVCGPREYVFHCLPSVVAMEDWESMKHYLRSWLR